jgi:hypothetical protein
MSYSRWQDDRVLAAVPRCAARTASEPHGSGSAQGAGFNFQRYYFQGIGSHSPEEAYRRGLADLEVLAHRLPAAGCLHGGKTTTIDAAIYGFIANIHFYPIDTPLKQFVSAHRNLVWHCEAIHAAVTEEPAGEA